MPTPSSRGDNESVNFNSTCPDEQAPRAQSWLHPPPPYEEDISAGEIGGSNTNTSRSQPLAVDRESASSPSSPIMSPGVQLTSEMAPAPEAESMLLNEGEREDENKQVEEDEDMVDSNTANAVREERDHRSGRDSHHAEGSSSVRHTNALRTSSRDVNRYSIPETDVWEPFGVDQSLRRRLDTSGLGSGLTPGVDVPSPSSMASSEKLEDQDLVDEMTWYDDSPSFAGCDPTSLRIIPTSPSTYLRPGSRFVGTQQSERQVYDVQVEIKHVDLRESFLCGYLRIQGLTEDHPTLTTYFEGEIIGSKYGFNTKHKSWGANDRIDMSHWAKFAAFRQFAKQAKKGNFMIKEYLQKENIFMRWKEHFLVPDHRVRTIHGASFEGFYYICFNQIEGVVHGIYFHSKSEKFQQLELKHVEDKGCMSALEFR